MTLGNILGLNAYEILQQSGLFNLFYMVPLFAIAGYQDNKEHEISSWICAAICLGLIFHAGFWGVTVISLVICLVCTFFTLGPIDIKIFGQADFMMVAHFLTIYTGTSTGLFLMLIAALLWLLCLSIHLLFYRDESGNRWKPFTGMMIPALPSYAASMTIASVLWVVYLRQIFFAGL